MLHENKEAYAHAYSKISIVLEMDPDPEKAP